MSFELPREIYGHSSFERGARAIIKGVIDLTTESLPQPVSGWLRIKLGEHLPFTSYKNQLLVREILDQVLEKNSNCIDVGAHKGDFTRFFTKLAPLGNHIAIEPLPEMFNDLCGRFMTNPKVQIFQNALAQEAKLATFYAFDRSPGLSGLSYRTIAGSEIPREIGVQCVRLDDVVPSDRKIKFIKIDVEGGELGVLQGGEALIIRDRPFIWCEHSLEGAPAFGVQPIDFFRYATDTLGMTFFTAHDWLIKGKSLDSSSFEALVHNRAVTDFLLVPAAV